MMCASAGLIVMDSKKQIWDPINYVTLFDAENDGSEKKMILSI